MGVLNCLFSLFPAGAIHAVATVELAAGITGPAVVFGNFTLRRSSMEATLAHSIRYALWHDDWTNSTHDDFAIQIARMLTWQLQFPKRSNPYRPFSNRQLFALLFMGQISEFLCALPYDKKGKLTEMPQPPEWRQKVSMKARTLAGTLISGLSKQERQGYAAFKEQYIQAYVEAMRHRIESE